MWGAHIPMSWWTAVALVDGVLSSILLWRPLARRWDWRPRWTLLALLWLSVVLALTLTPGNDRRHIGLRECVPRQPSDLLQLVLHTGGGIVADMLNVLLTLPVTLAVVMATRRLSPALLMSPLLPLFIELTQTAIPGRVCAVSDLVTNTIGGLSGAATGWVLQRQIQARRRCLSGSAA